jgi:hypothetical protein
MPMTRVIACALATATAALLTGCGSGAAQPELTVQQLMAQHVQPTAEIYWEAVGSTSELVDGKPVTREFRPQTDAEWERVRQSAATLGEHGALLATPGYAEGRGADWVEISNSLVEVSKLAEQAAVEKNVDKVFEVGGTVYNVCTACHQAYPADEGSPAERSGEA